MAGLNAFGVVFELGDGAGAYTPVANVTNISGPGTERTTVDTTAHDSPGGWQEFVGGLKNGGELSLTLNYDPREHDTLLAQFDTDTPVPVRVRWPQDVAHMTFDAVMTNYSPEAPHDDKLTLETTWQVAGKPTAVLGAPTAPA